MALDTFDAPSIQKRNESNRKDPKVIDAMIPSSTESMTRITMEEPSIVSSSDVGSNRTSYELSFFGTKQVVVIGNDFNSIPASIRANITAFNAVETSDPSAFITW
eukprot:CAMPEP_0204625890 /NCGR_PEP_ID=MMETSP0717-20131115/11518_1 /ASSEMBLY_ACC=CAM_ASM_000666 /TAXON_ID=230516 /ORGANISM="Chaetoceros curvisetus" /LENGTH=104 /DNA_ID=CAMNT_0051641679 /DNA_START=81 /DNA_END=392 /DNA_ORIENTATION=+